MPEQTLVFEAGETFATMSPEGRVRRWRVDGDGLVRNVHPEPGPVVPSDHALGDLRASIQSILTDVVADALVQRVMDRVMVAFAEQARIADERYRLAPVEARLVDINLDPREGTILAWASQYSDSTCVRLNPDDIRLIFASVDDGSRTSVSLATFRKTERVSDGV